MNSRVCGNPGGNLNKKNGISLFYSREPDMDGKGADQNKIIHDPLSSDRLYRHHLN